VLKKLLANHPLECPSCVVNNGCSFSRACLARFGIASSGRASR
ncbi:MAG: hypothetical protein KKF42_02175, partial [Actinobacteria bacterium]|nr:hypothetical protein [Actinomycetota bacterium]